ncbi:MAG: formate dehydrogenase accessory sulfurtransferase FdhD [Novosphingobium sp.]
MKGAVEIQVQRSNYRGADEAGARWVPVEAPIAIEINGIAYAVMMATPLDIEDFVTGFLLGEGLADASEIGTITTYSTGGAEWGEGLIARVNLPAHRAEPIMQRARRRLGDSSCGICGIESIDLALRPLPKITRRSAATPIAIKAALDALATRQPLGALTAASHAAAYCDELGTIITVREDVGRHNALDKLIGALAREGRDAAQGFIIMTSRCSYELVEKAVRAQCPLLVTISAPTDLAVRRAKAAGLALAVVARSNNMLWVTSDLAELCDGL